MRKLSEAVSNSSKAYTLQPQYCVLYHPVRKKLDLSIAEYVIIDGIDKLSRRPDHPWCTQSKEAMADFVEVSRATVFRAIEKGLKKDLIEKNERGDLRPSSKWIEAVSLYKERVGAKSQ